MYPTTMYPINTPDACSTCSGRGCGDCGNSGLEELARQHGVRRADEAKVDRVAKVLNRPASDVRAFFAKAAERAASTWPKGRAVTVRTGRNSKVVGEVESATAVDIRLRGGSAVVQYDVVLLCGRDRVRRSFRLEGGVR